MSEIRMNLQAAAAGLFAGTPVEFAYLYGSHATGLSHVFSDLDVAIFVEGLDVKACLDLELSLALRIDESLGHVVQSDVRVLNHLPLDVKGSILTDGQLLYSRAEEKRVEFETQTRRAYFDFLPVIRRHQRACWERAVSGKSDGIH